jgi:hypothetical protein
MSRDDDRPGFLDRDKKSFSERDRERRERRGSDERRDRGPGLPGQDAFAKKQYLKQVDSIFAKGKGGAGGDRLAQAVRDARGTQGLAAACRGYRDAQGAPSDAGLAACFLDAGEADVVLVGLEALAALRADGSLGATPGLRTQLRMLAQDPDDAVAGAAEALLDGL